MTGALILELTLITRRVAWPVALACQFAGSLAFAVVWGLAGGVPVWSASPSAQLGAADRLVLAVVVPWLVAHTVLSPDERAIKWLVVSGLSGRRAASARCAAVLFAAVVVGVSAVPAIAICADVSATGGGVLAETLALASFAAAAAGVTLVCNAFWTSPSLCWFAGIAATLVVDAAVSRQSSGAGVSAACALLAAGSTWLAASVAGRRIEEPAS